MFNEVMSLGNHCGVGHQKISISNKKDSVLTDQLFVSVPIAIKKKN